MDQFQDLLINANDSFEFAENFKHDPPAGITSKFLVEQANKDILQLIEFVRENYDVLKEQYTKKVD
jgi:hypothetical protein